MRNKSFARFAWIALAFVGFTTGISAEQVRLEAALGTPVVLAGQRQTAYLRVAMTGLPMENGIKRTPANVALVLDRSGSMQGEKIARLKEAAIMALDRLNGEDIVSVVAYDTTVEVLVPATRLSDREVIYSAIQRLQAGNSTALFGGVSKGAQEVRKFLDRNRVNRIILLSDGLANVGPSSPGEFAELGISLAREGIAVSTLGLGLDYNEDLMTALAQKSDGNHWFIENSEDLKTAFNKEFGDVVSVVAQDVSLRIACANGIRPVRTLGRSADLAGQVVTTSLNQIYDRQMKYLLLELAIPPGRAGDEIPVANVELDYANMATGDVDKLRQSVNVSFSESPDVVKTRTNADVMVAAVQQIGMEWNRQAIQLRDEGKVEEARKRGSLAIPWFLDNAFMYDSEFLRKEAQKAKSMNDALNERPEEWNKLRKEMQYYQYSNTNQQGGQAPSTP